MELLLVFSDVRITRDYGAEQPVPRKFMMKYLEVKHHDASNFFANGSPKIS